MPEGPCKALRGGVLPEFRYSHMSLSMAATPARDDEEQGEPPGYNVQERGTQNLLHALTFT